MSLDLKANTLRICVYLLQKSVIKYYTGQNSTVYTFFLDAANALIELVTGHY